MCLIAKAAEFVEWIARFLRTNMTERTVQSLACGQRALAKHWLCLLLENPPPYYLRAVLMLNACTAQH